MSCVPSLAGMAISDTSFVSMVKSFNSFRRKTRSKALSDFKLRRQEKFLYICDTLHMWEWDVRVLDIEDGVEEDRVTRCLSGRGAAPPEHCGGPTGYRLMLKRQRVGAAMWDLLRSTLDDGFRSLDRRLKEYGPLQPDRFHLGEANERLGDLQQSRSFRPRMSA